MQIGVVGLGRMGANIVRRLLRDGHECVVHDSDPAVTESLAAEGARPALTLAALAEALAPPRAVWVMVPAEHAGTVIDALAPLLGADDIVIDGGNSYYRDDLARAERLATRGIGYLDVGTSGGVFGLERGYCLMIGGAEPDVLRLAPLFDTLAPGIDAAPRTEGRTGAATDAEAGWLHCGPTGAGHFAKMVHNGIEYGLMAAYAEGFDLLRHAGDGGSTPDYEFDVPAIAELWRRGSVVSSWLLDLTAAALHHDPGLEGLSGHVADSGEGRWTLTTAVERGVPVPVLSAALFARFTSQGGGAFGNRLLSAMRREFGGHREPPTETGA